MIETKKSKSVMDKMEGFLDKQVEQLNEKEQIWVYRIKNFIFDGYNNWIKPILIAMFMFFLFTKIKNLVGLEEAMFIQLTVIIIYLRVISSKIKR